MALDKYGIAKRIARELEDGMYVNLGIGIPTLVANYIPPGMFIMPREADDIKVLDARNKIIGTGPFIPSNSRGSRNNTGSFERRACFSSPLAS